MHLFAAKNIKTWLKYTVSVPHESDNLVTDCLQKWDVCALFLFHIVNYYACIFILIQAALCFRICSVSHIVSHTETSLYLQIRTGKPGWQHFISTLVRHPDNKMSMALHSCFTFRISVQAALFSCRLLSLYSNHAFVCSPKNSKVWSMSFLHCIHPRRQRVCYLELYTVLFISLCFLPVWDIQYVVFILN